jgi:hypothetical protein
VNNYEENAFANANFFLCILHIESHMFVKDYCEYVRIMALVNAKHEEHMKLLEIRYLNMLNLNLHWQSGRIYQPL